MNGYKPCGCRDCMEVAIGEAGKPALCHACEDAGCSLEHEHECLAEGAYGEDYACEREEDHDDVPVR